MKPEGKYKGSTRYDLVANIIHEGEPNGGSYRVHVLNKVRDSSEELFYS
jgi:hypothetical protein